MPRRWEHGVCSVVGDRASAKEFATAELTTGELSISTTGMFEAGFVRTMVLCCWKRGGMTTKWEPRNQSRTRGRKSTTGRNLTWLGFLAIDDGKMAWRSLIERYGHDDRWNLMWLDFPHCRWRVVRATITCGKPGSWRQLNWVTVLAFTQGVRRRMPTR